MLSDVIDMFGKEVVFSDETDTHVSVSVKVNERAAEQFAKKLRPGCDYSSTRTIEGEDEERYEKIVGSV